MASSLALPLDRRGISTLSLAHVFNDLNQSAVPAMLPFLVAREHLSLAAAASLILAMNLSSSVVQPLFGWLSDRRSLLWVIPVSLLVASFGTAAIGLMHAFAGMFFAALVAGVGVAAFHPEGSRYANYCARGQRATGMGWFTLGGYGGFALGPLLVTPLVLAFGLQGTVFLAIPGAAMAAVLALELRRLGLFRKHAHAALRAAPRSPDRWTAFAWLVVVVVLRSTAFFGSVTFLPLFFVRVLHAGGAEGNAALAAMLIAGAAGTVLGGRLADRFERRSIVTLSIGAIALFTLAIALAGRWGAAPEGVLGLAMGLGLGMALSASVLVVLGQEYLPNRIGVASGVTLGLAVSVGGIAAPVFGAIGDRFGLVAVFASVAFVAALSWAATFLLPRVSTAA